ncbi:MAG: M28 family peptidase, partial [Armatimonadetes bacterium]|nr:M28 family peptidase [Armatimonadota bacterium]
FVVPAGRTMFRKDYDLLATEVSGDNARRMCNDIWRWDRTSSFAEHYKSARYCVDRLKEAGARDVEIITFPATGRAVYGAYRLQRAWDGHDAELHIVQPEASAKRLCSYRDDPYCLAQGSTPTPRGGIEARVIVIDGGAAAKDYRGKDVKGKFILTNSAPRSVMEMAKKRGAVGIITDHMPTNPAVRPTPMDVPDARVWMVMRPTGKLPAFVLTPRQGQELRRLIEERRRKGGVTLRAWVDARPYDGRHEMVTACIPGFDRTKEVALVAHLYEPGANDNASGAAVLLETVRVLNRLIRSGELPRPRRTIRLWFTHEFQSLMALVHERPDEVERVIACANVDQIGENQGASGASLMYQDGPDALPSFLNHYTHALMEYFDSRPYTWGNESSTETRMGIVNTRFWMNDNFISDPSVGIPSVAFIAWPDKYYHTDHDTIERVDPVSLEKVATLAATWIYLLARAGETEAMEIAEMVVEHADRFMGRNIGRRLDAVRAELDKLSAEDLPKKGPGLLADAAADLPERVEYLRAREVGALESVTDLLTEAQAKRRAAALAELRAEIEAAADRWSARGSRRLAILAREFDLPVPDAPADKPLTAAERRAAAIVPYRRKRGIVQTNELPKKAQEALNRASKGGVPRLMLYWVNGERSLLDIVRATKIEGDGPPIDAARAIKWAEAMKAGGVIGFRRR